MKTKFYCTFLTLAFFLSTTVAAATLGLTTGNPVLQSNSITVDYLEFGGDGDLSSFFNSIDSSSGVTPVGFTDLSFGAAFPLSSPTLGTTGFFDIFDDNGQFLSGDLLAVGFTEDVIELQFNNLIGSAAGNFGASALMMISFVDQLGANPFIGLVDGTFYDASVHIASVVNTVPVSEPAILSLYVLALLLMGFFRVSTHNQLPLVHRFCGTLSPGICQAC